MKSRFKSRPRWLLERWVRARADELTERWTALRKQLLPADWPARCARMAGLEDADVGRWQPAAGSSSAELLIVVRALSLRDRRWLGALLDAPSAGATTLVEAVERLQLDWHARLDPLHTHREYAEQLVALAERLHVSSSAASAYLDNERKVAPCIDRLLFESLPMRLRMRMINEAEPGQGVYLHWWHEELLTRCGDAAIKLDAAEEYHWPDIPAAWLALGWIARLRAVDSKRMAPVK